MVLQLPLEWLVLEEAGDLRCLVLSISLDLESFRRCSQFLSLSASLSLCLSVCLSIISLSICLSFILTHSVSPFSLLTTDALRWAASPPCRHGFPAMTSCISHADVKSSSLKLFLSGVYHSSKESSMILQPVHVKYAAVSLRAQSWVGSLWTQFSFQSR